MLSRSDKEKEDTTSDGDICSLVGKVGLWHAVILTVIFTNAMFNAFGQLSMAFMLPKVNYTCARSREALEHRMSQETWTEVTQYSAPELLSKMDGFCYRRELVFEPEAMFPHKRGGLSLAEADDPAGNDRIESENFPPERNPTWNISEGTVKCSSWDFDRSVYRATIVEQWHLMCDNDYLRPFPQAVAMAGLIVGNVVVSHFSDRFGRRLSVLCGIALCAVAGITATSTSNFIVFNAGRFVSSISKIGINSAIVIFLETSDASSRWMFSIISGCGFHLGMILLSVTAYHATSWRILQGAIASPCVILLPFTYFFCESPRWLLSKKRIDDGISVIRRITKMNGVPQAEVDARIPAIRQRYNNLRTPSHKSAIDLFRSSGSKGNMTCNTLIMWYLCFAYGLLFYSSIFISTSLGTHPHLSFCIPVVGELCAILLVALGVRFLRRRLIVFVTAFLGGAGFLILGFTDQIFTVHNSRVLLRMAAVILIRSSTAAFTQLYPVYSAELYQTPLRNVGIGFCDLMFRLASTVDPFGRYWLPRIHERLLPVLYACLGFTAALLSLFLPETLNTDLDDGIFGRLSASLGKLGQSIRRRASIFSIGSAETGDAHKKNPSSNVEQLRL